MKLKKILLLALVFCSSISLIFTSFSLAVQPALADDFEDKKQRALVFVEKVAGINLTNYSFDIITIEHGKSFEVDVEIFSQQGNVTICVIFIKGKISWVYYKPKAQSWLWTDKANDCLLSAKEILNRYQLYFNASCTQFIQLLNQATPDEDQVIKQGNMTLKITEKAHKFFWTYVDPRGKEVNWKTFSIAISNDTHLTGFFNWWEICTLGSTEISVSKEQAIDIALPYAQRYAAESGRTIKSVNATLHYVRDTGYKRGNDEWTVYPEWDVEIGFEPSGNNITGYNVLLWADTGAVYDASEQEEWPETQNQNNYLPFIVVAVISASAAITIPIAYKKHAKKKR
jgi:hypothetical protein